MKNLSPNIPRQSRTRTFLDVLFVLWLVAVNILYYAQFQDLFVSRLAPFISRWR